nr:restriction endonuclease [Quadrisphaera sp. RL12-1S]
MDQDFGYTKSLSPKQFEEQVARLLRRDGWFNAAVVGGANDRGADVIATRNGHKMVVQCKRYFGHKVTSREMQQFVGMCYDEHRATIAVFVTTSSFTKEARAIATSRRVVLIEERDFTRWQSFGEGDFLRIGATS